MNKRKRGGKSTKSQPGRGKSPGPAIALFAVIVVALGGLWWWKVKQSDAQFPASPPTASGRPTAAATDNTPSFEVLKGKWLRPDGDYVVEIRSVDDSGRMDASYLNPQPIKVSKAEASRDGAAIKVFIELRDANYPGSTYTLIYEPEGDQLKGIYYQAALQQRFEVIFTRMK